MDISMLNAAQQAAVTFADGPQLIIAGAGTGKTRTLVHRVAWLIDQGVPAHEICLLTFTRRAASEMLERAARMAGPDAHRVRGGTFHSFANRQLRRYADRLGYGPRYTILDRSDAQNMVGLIRGEFGLGGRDRRFARKSTILSVLSKQVNTGRDLRDILEDDYPQYLDDADDYARIRDRFIQRKKQQNVLDFDDLLVRFAELLRDHDSVRTRISNGCRYVLVDEYQDTNNLQGLTACLLASVHNNLTVVGDEAQSIYGFRGANVDNILNFPELFPTCKVHRLEQNYRSSQPVLDLANGVIESMASGFDKRLWSNESGQELPAQVDVVRESEQAEFIVRHVLELREQGVPLQDMAVLFRSAFHANVLEVHLTEANLPYKKFGGIQFTEAAHIKDLFALLRVVANPRDAMSWYRILQWFEGLGAKTAERMAIALESGGVFDPEPFKARKFGAAVAHLAAVLDRVRPLASDLEALVDALIEYYIPILQGLYEDHTKRVRDLDALPVLARRFGELDRFLTDVVLDPIGSTEAEDEGLTLSTIHSAKGLEWHSVWVLQLRDGAFPSGYSLDDEHALDEERRLFYVAVTRAKQNLWLMRPQVISAGYNRGFSPGCTLLDDVPMVDDLVQVIDGAPPPPPPVDKHPDIVAAEDRMAKFLDFFGHK